MRKHVDIPMSELLGFVEKLANQTPMRRVVQESDYTIGIITSRLTAAGLPKSMRDAERFVRKYGRLTSWSPLIEFQQLEASKAGVDHPLPGRVDITSLRALKSDLGLRENPSVNLISFVCEWDGGGWRIVRCRHYVHRKALSQQSAQNLVSAKQVIEALEKVRNHRALLRLQAAIWLHKLPDGGLHIYPATVVSQGIPLYQQAA
jgi:hypothetical protein